ncbi:hypothetical protein [Halorubrum depositum]|uniref:hypothetical protein n=1 Tax=Halorubrum depositum TaxID=2583992 RepID=UPI0016425E5E|nr:hypothetical protein [Halorubrum depositum]
MTESETDPSGRPALLAAIPSAERVAEWMRTLALLAGVMGLLIALFVLELLTRL